MDEKRLQEIKKEIYRLRDLWKPACDEGYLLAKDIHIIFDYAVELIAAYEQAQAELAEANKVLVEVDDIRIRQAEHLSDVAKRISKLTKECADLRAQLAEVVAERDKLKQERKEIGKAWNVIRR